MSPETEVVSKPQSHALRFLQPVALPRGPSFNAGEIAHCPQYEQQLLEEGAVEIFEPESKSMDGPPVDKNISSPPKKKG